MRRESRRALHVRQKGHKRRADGTEAKNRKSLLVWRQNDGPGPVQTQLQAILGVRIESLHGSAFEKLERLFIARQSKPQTWL